jgi:hypothetical protein
MICSENRYALFGIMRSTCLHAPGGSDSKDNTKVIKPELGTVAGAGIQSRGG